jgi:hypothetical protein
VNDFAILQVAQGRNHQANFSVVQACGALQVLLLTYVGTANLKLSSSNELLFCWWVDMVRHTIETHSLRSFYFL